MDYIERRKKYLSYYRLGDLYDGYLNKDSRDGMKLIEECPNSIGAEYIKRSNNEKDIKVMTEIALEFIDKYKDNFPEDIYESTVIHVRLGDVVAGINGHEILKRPLDIEYYKNKILTNEKIYIIGKCFFAEPSSPNYEECEERSKEYLNILCKELNATHFSSNNADIDLCVAVSSKRFFQGRGYYSKIIADIRKYLNKETVETSVLQK